MLFFVLISLMVFNTFTQEVEYCEDRTQAEICDRYYEEGQCDDMPENEIPAV
ncbi:hypothetical protein GCK32_004808, partial [Trichostrongylus colubriformis]